MDSPVERSIAVMRKSGSEITRQNCCPFFSQRRNLFAEDKTCWLCKYAWFELEGERPPKQDFADTPSGRRIELWAKFVYSIFDIHRNPEHVNEGISKSVRKYMMKTAIGDFSAAVMIAGMFLIA